MATSAHADPLEAPPPRFSIGAVEVVLGAQYGLSGSITPLDSERDQNFRVRAHGDQTFLLKISNQADELAALEMQTQAMRHIRAQDPELPVMQPLRTSTGEYLGMVADADGIEHYVRLFTFLAGQTAAVGQLSFDDLHVFGSVVARVGRALRGFWHPAGGYRILWDLKHAPGLRPLLDATADHPRRRLLTHVLDRFDDRVATTLPGLRSQLIHNDLTLDNVLFDGGRISGIVDFGDLTHTALICDLAVALVSVMWERADPLEAARATIEGYRTVTSIERAEADVLGDLIAARLASLIIIANWRVRRYPENTAYIMASVDSAWDLLALFDELGWSDVEVHLRAASSDEFPAEAPRRRPGMKDLLTRRERVLGPALSPLTYDRPLYLVRGRGSHLFDHEGTAYLDAYNNVPVVGHCHPRVASAIAEQSATLNTNTRYLHHSVVELAERIIATMPNDLDTVTFFNSGSEANDIAWRLASGHRERPGAIVTDWAYHGVTTLTTALSPEGWPRGERPEYVETVPPPDGLRGPYAHPPEADRYAGHIDDAAAKLRARGIAPTAFFVDSLFTSDGIFHPPAVYLQKVARRVRTADCLFVADEVQCGYGRAGTHMWSFQASGITPDFVSLGKPMGNGHPVAAVVTRREIAERFAAGADMFSTFGGNPVVCKAALAVLDVIEEEQLLQHAHEVGHHLRAGLTELKGRHAAIGDVRGAGLLLGVELVDDGATRTPAPGLARAILNGMRDRGVLIGTTGPLGNVLKIRPPLVLTTTEADVIVETLDDCLSRIAGSPAST
jgi:4-aminobutyrate aminotransferase-like enzyme/Ser/Thr protein kinase RdoA (MazF antagonist)